MRQRPQCRLKFAPGVDSLSERCFRARSKMPGHRILADDERERDGAELAQDFLAPGSGAFGTRRRVAGLARAGITKAHRQNCHALRVVKRFPVEAEPVAEAVAAGVIKGNAGCVNLTARRLPGDEDARSAGDLQDGARAERQVLCA